MNVVDAKIRVEISDRGGTVLHFPAFKTTPDFCIFKSIDGKWRHTIDQKKLFDTILECYWDAKGWGDTVQPTEFYLEGIPQ